MEPENTQNENQSPISDRIAPLKQVTPLSKYLALALFIILPFVGGYVGYVYAPEKVVEVEKIVTTEVEVGSDKTEIDIIGTTDSNLSCPQASDKTDYYSVSDVRCNKLALAGLDLFSYEVNNIETVATFRSVQYPEIGDSLSGEFSLGFNEMFGKLMLTYYPDEESKKILNGEERFAVVPVGDEILDVVFPESCNEQCLNLIRTEGIKFSGIGNVTEVRIILHNIGAGTIGNTIEFGQQTLVLEQTN